MKKQGNDYHESRQFDLAEQSYTKALEALSSGKEKVADREHAILFSNRAGSRIELGTWKSAKKDTQQAMKLDPTYLKVSFQ